MTVASTEPSSLNTVLATPIPPARQHLNFLDGIRALCALWVVAAHGLVEVWPAGDVPGVVMPHRIYLATRFLNFCRCGVDVFIVISGFCLMIPVVRNGGAFRGGIGNFIKKRAKRILPPYYAAMALSLVLIATLIGTPGHTHWDIALPVGWSTVLQHLLLVHDFGSAFKINHVFWSIAVEWQIYFVFPLIVLGFSNWGIPRTAIVTFILAYGVRAFFIYGILRLAVSADYVFLFFMGMVAAQFVFDDKPCPWLPWAANVLTVSCAVVVVILCAVTTEFHSVIIIDLFTGAAAAALIISLATRNTSRVCRFLELGPFVWVGTFSYSLYLIHAPLEAVAFRYLIRPMGISPTQQYLIIQFVAEPIIVGLSFLFFLACERPFMNTAGRKAADKNLHVIRP
ncbi:MAG: acyltransferase [Planctomycetota bacterium]|nr:acyltransferase [Planctomycetota bacterium]